MIKDSLSVDTILEIFVSGGLFIIGVWYLNRTFLAEYFPGIAATVEADDKLVGNKIVIFLVLALFFGILITHLVDIVIPFIIGSKEYSSKRYKRAKKVGFLFIRLFSWIEEPDPRVVAVQRYLDSSSRREWFLRMVQDWTMTNSEAIREKDEMVKAHQHIVVRLRVLSDGSRKALKEAYDQVSFSGSIFVALLLLIPVSFVSFLTNTLVLKPRPVGQIVFLMTVIYVLTIITGYSLRRRLRTFFSQILTIALSIARPRRLTKAKGCPR